MHQATGSTLINNIYISRISKQRGNYKVVLFGLSSETEIHTGEQEEAASGLKGRSQITANTVDVHFGVIPKLI